MATKKNAPEPNPNERKGITFRLPLWVIEGLRSLAEENDRTLNGQVSAILKTHLKASGIGVESDGDESDGGE